MARRLRLSDAERARLLTPLDPYDNPLLMPLREFEAHPMAAELLHNGQAYQVTEDGCRRAGVAPACAST